MNAQKYLHTAPPYVAADPAAIVRRHPFAVLITSGPAGILASSLPMFFEREDSTATMVGHAARLNTLMVNLKGGESALAVFSGPHAYVSSGWYRERPSVPTWNYIAAQVRGTLEPIDDEAGQLAVLERTVSLVEQGNEPAWSLPKAPAGMIAALLPRIRSFRLTVERIEGVTKLSQAQPAADRRSVIDHLLQRNGDGDAAIAQLMAAFSAER